MMDAIAEDKQLTEASIRRLAFEHAYVTGNWEAKVHARRVDEIWQRLVKGLLSDRLDGIISLRVNSAENTRRSDHHCISAVTSNFFDEDEVMAARNSLRRCGIKGTMTYNPDIYSRYKTIKCDGLSSVLYEDEWWQRKES